MIFPHAGNVPRHPSQLYEFFLEGVLLFLILFWFTRKKRPLGATSALFAIGYGAFRFLVEFFREPDETKGISYDWLTMGQVLSIPLILVGILLFMYAYSKQKKQAFNS